MFTVKISKLDKIRWAKKAMPAVKRILSSEKEQDKLIDILNKNGYPELAEIGSEAKKYAPDAKKALGC